MKRKMNFALIFLASTILGVGCLVHWVNNDPKVIKDNLITTIASEKDDIGIKAGIYAKNICKGRLKSPSTADFNLHSQVNMRYDSSRTFIPNETIWIVENYVDAQNSFGAKLRKNYSVTLSYNKVDKTFTLISFKITE
jgi:hypothetical protein